MTASHAHYVAKKQTADVLRALTCRANVLVGKESALVGRANVLVGRQMHWLVEQIFR